jgi:hypothetical protein
MPKKFEKIKFQEGIFINKTRATWICVCCEKEIKDGEVSFNIVPLKTQGSNEKYVAGFGVRLHLRCGKKFGENLDFYSKKKNWIKFKILQRLK